MELNEKALEAANKAYWECRGNANKCLFDAIKAYLEYQEPEADKIQDLGDSDWTPPEWKTEQPNPEKRVYVYRNLYTQAIIALDIKNDDPDRVEYLGSIVLDE